MAYVDNEMIQKLFNAVHLEKQRNVLLLFRDDKPFTFTELMEKTHFTSNILAHHIRKLKSVGLIQLQGRYYLLTRVGIELTNLIKGFEEICMKFNLDECDEEGKIKVIIERNKNGRN